VTVARIAETFFWTREIMLEIASIVVLVAGMLGLGALGEKKRPEIAFPVTIRNKPCSTSRSSSTSRSGVKPLRMFTSGERIELGGIPCKARQRTIRL